jgi:hypothetical protein
VNPRLDLGWFLEDLQVRPLTPRAIADDRMVPLQFPEALATHPALLRNRAGDPSVPWYAVTIDRA